MSRTTVSCLERLLATCLGLPHGQRNGGRSTIDLQKQVLITIWILRNPKCLRSVADRSNEFLACLPQNLLSDCQQSFRSTYEVPTCLKLSIAEQNDKFRILRPKEHVGSMMQWSVFRSRTLVIRWILVQSQIQSQIQSGFDRSLIWKWICSNGTPHIRNPDPDSPKRTHPETCCQP